MMVYHISATLPIFQIFTQFIDAIDVTRVTLGRSNSINATDVTRVIRLTFECQMSNVNQIKPLSERTSGVSPVIFIGAPGGANKNKEL